MLSPQTIRRSTPDITPFELESPTAIPRSKLGSTPISYAFESDSIQHDTQTNPPYEANVPTSPDRELAISLAEENQRLRGLLEPPSYNASM